MKTSNARLFSAILLLLLVVAGSCKDEKTEPADVCKNVLCTANVAFIWLEVKDQNGNPYQLDDYYTTKTATGDTISFIPAGADSATLFNPTGNYIVFSSLNIQLTTKSGMEFEFHGFKSGNKIVHEIFKIGHDCCHPKQLGGPGSSIVTTTINHMKSL